MQLAVLEYRATTTLVITNVSRHDFGDYMCVSSNLLGKSAGTVKVYGKFH